MCYLKHSTDFNVFQESKMFHQIMFFYAFSIEHPGDIFIYDTSCYFVIYKQFLRLHCQTLQ